MKIKQKKISFIYVLVRVYQQRVCYNLGLGIVFASTLKSDTKIELCGCTEMDAGIVLFFWILKGR